MKLIPSVLGAAALIVATTLNSLAADVGVPSFKAPLAPASVYRWTGLYFGAHAGGGWGDSNWFYPNDAINAVSSAPTGLPLNVSSGGHSASSWLAGAQIGYNYQIKNWVLGIEAEFSATGLKGSNVDPSFPNINHTQTDFIGTLAGRAGYSWDRVLLYGKAGLGWAHNNYSDNALNTFVSGGAPDTVTLPAGIVQNRASLNRFGFMLGAGVEYALSQNWSVKAEYNYLDFGKERVTLSPVNAGLTPFDEDIKQRIHLFKIGLNYRLDPPRGAEMAFAQAGRPEPAPRFYGGVDYLLWKVKGAPLSVPLLSSSNTSGNVEGLLLNPQTTILYGAPFAPAVGGNDTQNFKPFSGSKVFGGYWLDDAHRLAVEAGGFLLQSRTTTFSVQGDATGSRGMRVPVFTTPYSPSGMCAPAEGDGTATCLVPAGEDGVPVSVPGELTGSVTVKNSLQLWGLEGNGVVSLYRTPSLEMSAVSGVRYLNLSEKFEMTSTLAGVAGGDFAGQSGYTIDRFDTKNQFYGGTLGLRGRYNYGQWSLETMGRIALGVNQQTLSVSGYYQDFYARLPYSSGPYGIFAMPANAGTRSQNNFAVVPEFQAKLGFDVTPTIRITVGYDFMYFSNVIRPTDQIDRNIPKGQTYQQDTTQADSSTVPAKLFKSTDFYAQGLNVGINARF